MKLADYLKKAREENFAIGAFNIDSLETLRGVAEASRGMQTALIAEVSPGEQKYLGLQNFVTLTSNLKSEYGVEIFLNLDHADDLEIVKNAIELGFDMVHFDGSKLPVEENMRLVKEVVSEAHDKGALVEGEMDTIGEKITDPEMAKKFVEETGVDIFAVSIGNKHGVYEDGSEKLDLKLLGEIRKVLPATHFSLHGGSGIEAEDIREALGFGVVKINVNTELRMAFRETLENMLKGNPEEFAWYKLAMPAVEAVREVVEGKIKLFKS